MPVKTTDEGNEINAFGWATAAMRPLPVDLPERTLLKVLDKFQPGAWAADMMLKVRDAGNRHWEISVSCFEPRLKYSFDNGETWLPEKHQRVRAYLLRELKHAMEIQAGHQRTVDTLRWQLDRSGAEIDRRLKEITRLQALIERPCTYGKPGRGRSDWLANRQKAEAELKRLQNGADFPKDPYSEYPY